MKLDTFELALVNSSLRRFFQKNFEVPMLIKLGGMPQMGRVAEIGCGNGYGLKLLLDVFKVKVVHGFDIDEKMLNKASAYLAKEIMEHKVFLHNEDDKLSQIQSHEYSTIFFFGSLHHIPYWRNALKASCESLEEGGKIYLWEFYRPLTMNRFVQLFVKHPKSAAFSHSELKLELKKNGLKILGEKNFLSMAGMIVVAKDSVDNYK